MFRINLLYFVKIQLYIMGVNNMNFLLGISQFFFTAIIGVYFLSQLLQSKENRNAMEKDSKKELEKLIKLEKQNLTTPLNEKTRPTSIGEIIGQEDGIKALSASICSKNPQHVIIYGPAGVGKTAAARVILEKAKDMEFTPFKKDCKFIETDATTMRYDERSIADPLIGSVHDPIYQGAGAYGSEGVPQPKIGAVSKAHGGVLFIDEIGELHPVQWSRLLKVLEDRRVFFESAYYSEENKNIPSHIHKIFKDGYPADFRLIGATTRSPEEIPDAIRSRCVEIYFKPLSMTSIKKIAKNAVLKSGFCIEKGGCDLISQYAKNGRDAVNIVQMSISKAELEKKDKIEIADIQWVLEAQKYFPVHIKYTEPKSQIGIVNGLSVTSFSQGMVMEIECSAYKCEREKEGTIKVTGIVEEEEFEIQKRHCKKQSMAKISVENAITLIKSIANFEISDYNIHINFPGGIPVDGPSAGAAIFCAMYSALFKKCIKPHTAITGEISVLGHIKKVGGVYEKIEACEKCGIKRVIIPSQNYQKVFEKFDVEIITVNNIYDVINECFDKEGDLPFSGESIIRSAKGEK